jgi:hypothetical protein
MTTHYCAKHGKYGVSLTAVVKPMNHQSYPAESVVSTVEIEHQSDVQITTVKELIRTVTEIESSLLQLSHHPVDQSLVGVETSSMSQLQLLLLRTQGRQRRIDGDLDEETQQEAEITKSLTKSLRPLYDEIVKKKADAEAAMEILNKQPNPSKAKKVLLGIANSSATILRNDEVLVHPTDTKEHGSLTLTGDKVHHIRIRVLELKSDGGAVHAQLVGVDQPSALFMPSDFGSTNLILKSLTADNLFFLAQAASLNWTVSITATFNVTLNNRGCSFTGSLVSVPDGRRVAGEIRAAVDARTASLFE